MAKKTRREILVDRVVELCDRINDDLPVKVTSIGMFGSFCRQKEYPNDIDLVLTYDENITYSEWEVFICALYEIQGEGTVFDWADRTNMKEPYKTWCSVITNTMFSNQSSHGYIGRLDVTLRLLVKGLPKLKFAVNYSNNLKQFSKEIGTTVYKIWSAKCPDVRKNIEKINSKKNVRKLANEAYCSFLPQLEQQRNEIKHRQDIIRSLLSARTRKKVCKDYVERNRRFKEFKNKYSFSSRKELLNSRPEPAKIDLSNMKTEDILLAVEKMREEMKLTPKIERVLSELKHSLSIYKCRLCITKYQNMVENIEAAIADAASNMPLNLIDTLNLQLDAIGLPRVSYFKFSHEKDWLISCKNYLRYKKYGHIYDRSIRWKSD